MKTLLTYILLLISLSCLSKNNYEVENILYAGINQKFREAGIDLEKQIRELEMLFIKDGIISGTSGKDLVAYFESVKEKNDIGGLISEEQFNNISIVPISDFYDTIFIDSLKTLTKKAIKKSKLMDFRGEFEKSDFRTSPSPSKFADIFLKTLDENDLNNKFYKTFSIILIANTSDIDFGLLLPSKTNHEFDEKTLITIDVLIKNNQTFINNIHRQDSVIYDIIKYFIDENQPNYLIKLSNTIDTKYDYYIKIQEILIKSIKDCRDAVSIERFGNLYSDLTIEQQKEIKKLYPTNIRESEPDGFEK